MKFEKDKHGFFQRVILSAFVASWLVGEWSLLLTLGMGLEAGFLTSDKDGVIERVGQGLLGGFAGLLGGFTGILAFVLVVTLVAWITGIELADVSFVKRWRDE